MRKIPIRVIVTSVALVCAASAISLEAYSVMNGVPHWFIPTTYVAPATSIEIAAWTLRLGYDPESLAAAGVGAAQTSELLAVIRDSVSQNIATLRSVTTTLAAAQRDEAVSAQQVRSFKGGDQRVTVHNDAKTALATAQSGYDSALQSLRSAAQSVLSEQQSVLLNQLKAARRFDVALAYGATVRDNAAWLKLRNSLAHQRQAQDRGAQVDAGVASYLSTVEADPNVIAAKAALASNKAAVEAAWNSALANH